VAFRIFPEHVEVDVLHSDNQILPLAGAPAAGAVPATPTVRAAPAVAPAVHSPPAATAPAAPEPAAPPGAAEPVPAQVVPTPPGPVTLGQRGHPATFAEWMSTALRREGLTQEAAARQLGVSVKTVSRWVGGATEPRMRDLRRIQEVFGQVPLP
jgi:DNA-binding XRE family transcriptional regulator